MLKAYSRVVSIKTYGPLVLHPLSYVASEAIAESGIKNGIMWISVEGATPALVILRKGLEEKFTEYVSNLVLFKRWRHGNAHAHLISTIFSTTITIPVIDQALALGRDRELYLLETRSVYNHTRRIAIEIHGHE